MADDHDGLLLPKTRQQVFERLVARFRTQRFVGDNLVFMAELSGNDLRGLHSPRERAGDDDVQIEIERGKRAPDVMGLLFAGFVDGTFIVVLGGIVVVGTGMTQEVNVHSAYFALIVVAPVRTKWVL